MRRSIHYSYITGLVILLGSCLIGPVGALSQDREKPEQQLSTVAAVDTDHRSPARVAKRVKRRVDGRIQAVYKRVLNGFSVEVPLNQLQRFLRIPGVRRVSSNRQFTVSGLSRERLDASDQTVSDSSPISEDQKIPTGIRRIRADEGREVDPSERIHVAVIDSGIDGNHPDLQGLVEGGVNVVSDSSSSWMDDHGHGTHVAGIIAARANDRGVRGVAPGVSLLAVRAVSRREGSVHTMISGLEWVMNREKHPPVHVVNISLKAPSLKGNDLLHRAIQNVVDQGITVVVSAGNRSRNVQQVIPARYEEVITVSALADSDGKPGGEGPDLRSSERRIRRRSAGLDSVPDDSFAPYSNYGEGVDVIAPGMNILSTWLTDDSRGPYRQATGTSMAAPHVTGTIARMMNRAVSSQSTSRQQTTRGETVMKPETVQRVLRETGMRAPDGGWPGDPDQIAEPLVDTKEATDSVVPRQAP